MVRVFLFDFCKMWDLIVSVPDHCLFFTSLAGVYLFVAYVLVK